MYYFASPRLCLFPLLPLISTVNRSYRLVSRSLVSYRSKQWEAVTALAHAGRARMGFLEQRCASDHQLYLLLDSR